VSAPALVIKVDLEASGPAITVDAVSASQYRRLIDWVEAPADTCRLCDASLKSHEKREAICDRCLRSHQWKAA
jgi:hypothetical protein